MASRKEPLMRTEWLGRKRVAVLTYDAEDLRALAHAWGPRDGAFMECLDMADKLDELNGDEHD